MADRPRVVILGAGPAGLGAAFKLARRGDVRVTVLEQNKHVGGNAGSFELADMRVDYGSHRLHPSCDPEILRDIRALLGEDLLDRPRHGRIRLHGHWIHFPLKPMDLAFGLPPSFAVGVATDLLRKALNGRRSNVDGRPSSVVGHPSFVAEPDTFASVLEKGLGRTICKNFYFPYVEKIWGLKPDELAVTLAQRRISANSLSKMTQKIFAGLAGAKSNGKGRFFYPKQGYGQISEGYYCAAREAGADIRLGSRVKAVEIENGLVRVVYSDTEGHIVELDAGQVWSTIPVTILAKCLKPAAPLEILRAAQSIDYRAMILIYVVLEQAQFSEFDAHYFPEAAIPISRLSEPKNYSAGQGPKNSTVICAELPCSADGPEWNKSDTELGGLVCASLETAGIPITAPVRRVVTRRLRQAYPIYQRNYKIYFDKLDQWLSEIQGLLTFGRQGLFAHDNTHHALYMAYAAVKCLNQNGSFDGGRWQQYREIFQAHVVED
jgi:protoporphyrinogen oxidase